MLILDDDTLLAVLARGSGSHSGITSASDSYSGITSATAHSNVAGSEDVHDELLETVTEAEPISTASDPLSSANLDTLARGGSKTPKFRTLRVIWV